MNNTGRPVLLVFAAALLLAPLACGAAQLQIRAAAVEAVHVTGPRLDLKKLGAHGDGIHNDTATFRAAADIIEKAGGGRLVIPRGIYIVGEQTHADGQFPYYQEKPIFSVKNVDGLIIEGNGATVRLASGLRFGSFDKLTGNRIISFPSRSLL